MYSLSDDEDDHHQQYIQHGRDSAGLTRGQDTAARMRLRATPSPPPAPVPRTSTVTTTVTAPSAAAGRKSKYNQQEISMVSLDDDDDDDQARHPTAGSSRTQSRSPSLLASSHHAAPRPPRKGVRQGGGVAAAAAVGVGGGPSSPTLSSFAESVGSHPFTPAPAIDRLQRLWVAQRACPELLAWSNDSGEGSARGSERWSCDETVDEVCAQIEEQTSILNLLSSDEGTSEEEHLRLSMVQLDVERSKWLLRAFLRSRLHKLETFSMHYSSLSSVRRSQVLSPLEQAYLSKYTSIQSSHFSSSVLGYLPEALRSLTDGEDDLPSNFDPEGQGAKGSMVPRPDLGSPVFVRCAEDCGEVRTDEGENANLSKGSIHLLTYGSVRELVRQGRVELL